MHRSIHRAFPFFIGEYIKLNQQKSVLYFEDGRMQNNTYIVVLQQEDSKYIYIFREDFPLVYSIIKMH